MEGTHRRYTPRGPSARLLVSLALLVALLVACTVLLLVARATFDPEARAAAAAERWRQEEQAQRLEALDIAIAAGWRVLPLLVACGASVVALSVAWRRWGATPAVYADKQTAMARALTQRYPAGLQSLNTSYHNAPRLTTGAADTIDAPDVPMLPEGVPTFAQLLSRGRVGKGNPLLLGFDVETGGELVGSWLDLYSTIVSGLPGSGKTTSQRFLACQTALQGARFAICDPHAGAADDSLAATLAPLSAAFVCEPASSDKAILEVVRYVADVGRRRVEGKDSDTTPLILWLDETTALLGRSAVADDLAELIERIAQEYRKRGVFCCASGQLWTAARTTSELRDSFASVLCHRMKRAQARLILPTEEAEQVERLQTGRAVLWRTSGVTTIVQVPNTVAQDVTQVATLLASPRLLDMPKSSQHEAWNMPDGMPKGSQRVANDDLATTALESGTAASAEAMRAAALFFDGADPAAIVLALRGVKSSEGKRYQVALTEILTLIRKGARGA